MAIDSVSARYQAYDTAQSDLDPQIRGLQDKVNDTLSDELRAILQERLNMLQTIANQVSVARSQQQSADTALAALEDGGGFPTIPDTPIPPHLLDELAREDADNAAASGGFGAAAQASNIAVKLGTPVSKP